MPAVTLFPSSIEAATGWTGATVANLSASDDVRATGGTVAEFIRAALDDTPSDFDVVNGDVVLHVEARTLGTVSRAKTVLLELLDSVGTVLGSGSSGTLSGTDSSHQITISGRTDAKAAVDGWRYRLTVQEGGGMADTATVEVDQIRLVVNYAVDTGGTTGTADIPLAIGAAAQGGVATAGQAEAALALGANGAGEVATAGQGDVGLGLGAAAAGEVATEGSADAALSLGVDAAGEVPVVGTAELGLELGLDATGGEAVSGTTGTAELPLALGADAQGAIATEGAGEAALALGLDATGSAGSSGTTGTAELGLTLDAAGQGAIATEAQGDAALTLGADAAGAIATEGQAEVGLELGVSASGNPPPAAPPNRRIA
jgi:hypothetical protein